MNSVSFVCNQYPYQDTYCYFRQNDVNVSRVMEAVIERYTVQLSGFSTPITLETFPCLWSSCEVWNNSNHLWPSCWLCARDILFTSLASSNLWWLLSFHVQWIKENCITVPLQFSNILLYYNNTVLWSTEHEMTVTIHNYDRLLEARQVNST